LRFLSGPRIFLDRYPWSPRKAGLRLILVDHRSSSRRIAVAINTTIG
jgi:hypothetical protein